MKIRYLFFVAAMLVLTLAGTAQDLKERFGNRKEVYFRFRVESRDEIRELTRIISIDNVRNDTVWAYANMEEFLRFLSKGYAITFLRHPGDAPGVAMIGHYPPDMPATVWNFYPTYEAYESLMTQFQTTYPSLCKLYTFGTLTSGRKLMAVKISDNVATDEAEPEFFYTSSMHGDETTGFILMLHLIDYLLSNYGTNAEATNLVNSMEIFINPLANPDGTYHGGNSSVEGATRYNASGVDLNRNYPDIVDGDHPDGNPWQEETVAFMDFAGQHHFVASANFHGGAEVFNYPWDTWSTLAADDSWWYYVGREYADTVHTHSPDTYMDDIDNGVTNGFAWYQANGTRQDWMNYWQHCREVTIEISNTKLPPASQLETFWGYNWRSLILYMKEALYGIHGIVTDQATGNPVAAKIFMVGHDLDNSQVYSTASNGDYHRLLKGGSYTMEVSAPCYQTFTLVGVTVLDHTSHTINIQLIPGSGVSTATPTSITGTTAVSGGEVLCQGSSPISARGVCWGTSINPAISGNHTTDGSGLGAFVSNITGLNPNTQYWVRSYCTNASETSYGDNISFTTSCGVSAIPVTENFNNSTFPSCWTQQISGTGAVNSWSVSTTANAGGVANEMKSTYQNVSPATSRLVSIPMNTMGFSVLNLSFRHMFDAYGTGVTLKIQSSADGTNWTDEAWSVASTSSDIPATAVNTTITHNLDIPVTYLAFTLTGNLYQYDYWYVDNISVTGTTSNLPVVTTTPVTSITTTTAVSGGNIVSGGTSPVTARGVCWGITPNPTLADSHTTNGSGTGAFVSNLTSLSSGTTYHVRAYATNSSGTSYGSDISFTTTCGSISSFPWNEGFENGGSIPACWTQEFVTTPGLNWTFITGNGNGHPSAAHGGTYNACLKDNTASDNKTRLVTPAFNLSGLINPQVTFWHMQTVWSGDQDQLSVYYRTSAGGTWTLLTTYTTSITSWTSRTLTLPSPSADYYICFEGNAKYGYGVCVDDVSVSGTAPTLTVSPSSQAVTSSAGNTSFAVTSNTSWSAVSNQSWCTVTPSGSGNGSITANYSENLSADSRTAVITVTASGATPVTVSVIQSGVPYKTLNIKVFLEGLYNSNSTMREANDESVPHYGAGISDKVTVELHSSTTYTSVVFSSGPVNLSTSGMVIITNIPAILSGSYYITIRHRNSIEITSSSPVSFAGTAVTYDFSTSASQAYGNNQLNFNGEGIFAVWCGDVNQDGIIDSGDMNPVDNASTAITMGYVDEDLNGDGIVDSGDMNIVDNNSTAVIIMMTP